MTDTETANKRPESSDRGGSLTSMRTNLAVTPAKAWGMTGMVVLLYIVNYADKAILGVIAQPLAQELGMTAAQIGLTSSLFYLAFTIGGFAAGPLEKYLTLRWALLALGVIWAAVMLPFVVSATFAMLIATRMLLGLAEGPSTALMYTATYSWHPAAKRGLAGSVLGGAAPFAKIALAPVLTFITVEWGWRTALVTMSVVGLVWALGWMAIWKEGPYTKVQAGAGSAVSVTREPSVPWRTIVLSRTFLSCAFMIAIVFALVTVVLTWLPSYFEVGLGYTRLQAGSMLALPSIVSLCLMLALGAVTDRLRARGHSSRVLRVIVPGASMIICGVALICLPYIGAPALAVAVLSVGSAFATSLIPLLNAAVSELCPPQQTAGTMGLFMALMSIGGLVAPYATGVLVDRAATPAEGYALGFQVIAVAGIIAAVLAMVFANPDRDRKLIRGEL